MNEAFHISIRNGHRFAPRMAQPPVLQRGKGVNNGVEILAPIINKEQIGNVGNFPTNALPTLLEQPPNLRGEDLKALFLKQLISHLLAVGPFEVAHDEPL